MNLDELISKYLDSELSPAEDELLRSIISNDGVAHEKFDSAVALHMAFREDALSIETPTELVRETEDAILMKIIRETPVQEKVYSYKRNIPSFAGLVAVFLLFFVFNIDDLQMLNMGNMASNQVADRSERIMNDNERTVSSSDNIVTSDFTGDNIEAVDNTEVDNNDLNSELLASSETTGSDTERRIVNSGLSENAGNIAGNISGYASNFADYINSKYAASDNEVEEEIIADNQPVSDHPEITVSNVPVVSSSDNIINDGRKFSPDNPRTYGLPEGMGVNGLESLLNVDEVHVASFFGTDVFRGGMDCDDEYFVSHISQSLAYSLDKDSRIGLELGYSEYTYNENVIVPISSYPEPIGNSMVEVLPKTYIRVPVTINRQKQMFWGTAFYERSLYNRNSLSLQGRLGLGMSADGFLSFARLFGKYELISGLYLTVGGEFRMFDAELQILNGETMGVKTSASLVYGFQLKF